MIRIFLLSMLTLSVLPSLWSQLQSPNEFLPHRIGETFTPHHMLVDYVEHVAAHSPNVTLQTYGRTNEDRPLLVAYISSPENLARLEEIRENNLRRTGLLDGTPRSDLDRAIVWLSFSVHGNEAAGSESSMPVLYELANPENPRTRAWLENTVVILDPSVNPDGYSRYTHWYRRVANQSPDPSSRTREHREPWPGGRVNHYHFDLNRDWAWQTQVESRRRMALYHTWMPHIHVDVHEQGVNSPYYFAPAARPFHPYITDWQKEFQTTIGRNNARYFDENGWLYFTRERFDLFYPSYGDTYPTFNGAIGMTYEQGGSGRAGRAVMMENGDTLTLADRILHHQTTTLATVETASKNADQLIRNFEDFFAATKGDMPGAYSTFIIRGTNSKSRLKAFTQLLDRNQIRYGRPGRTPAVDAYNYQTGETGRIEVAEEDLVISVRQPQGRLAQVLLEPAATLEDSLTYDITAWSLPYAYGLEAFATASRIDAAEAYEFESYHNNLSGDTRAYAYLADWEALSNARFLADLIKHGISVRFASKPFSIEGKKYAAGTLVITRADNLDMGRRFHETVAELAQKHEQPVTTTRTGFSDNGLDIGSGAMEIIEPPRIAIASGEGTSSYGFGQLWYFFEQDLNLPVHIMPNSDIGDYDLDSYNVLVLPEGRYRLSEDAGERLSQWVADGGRLIAIGSANRSLEGLPGFGLDRSLRKDGEEEVIDSATSLAPYSSQERREISELIPGAIFRVRLDTGHPLAFGLSEDYFSLKTSGTAYHFLKDGWNVGTIGDELLIAGFAGIKAREKMKQSVVFAVQDRGRGSVTHLIDNPLYRAFWENGKFLFSNAVFFVGQ